MPSRNKVVLSLKKSRSMSFAKKDVCFADDFWRFKTLSETMS